MKDETIYQATPLKRPRLGDARPLNMGLLITLLALIIFIVILFYCTGNKGAAMSLAEILGKVQE